MTEVPTNFEIFAALDDSEAEFGCRFILEGDYPPGKADRLNALAFAAKLRSFRPEFLARRPIGKNAQLLHQASRNRGAQRLRADIVKAWLVGRHRDLLSSFLQACGIPEENGFVSGEQPPPAQDKLRRAIGVISAKFDARTVSIYLAYLLALKDAFWKNLHEAASPADIAALTEKTPEAEPEVKPATAEQSDEFTTLDNLLIQRAVATATNEIGALSEDQLEDLIEEIVELNSARQHSYFHRGYFHALFSRPLEFSFRGENAKRRLWYLAGAVMGLLRGLRKDQALGLLREKTDLFDLLCGADSSVVANMLLPQLFPIVWEAKELTMARRLLERHTKYLPPETFVPFAFQVYYKCAALLRRGQWEQAGWFLDFTGDLVAKRTDVPDKFREDFRVWNDRKRAQVLQLKGDFRGAERLLQSVVKSGHPNDQASALADLGLIRGKLRSLASALPAQEEEVSAKSLMIALDSGRADFEAACERNPGKATNAEFCIGLLDLLQRKESQSAADHFRCAREGMLGKEGDYAEGGIRQWTLFLLGISLLEAGQSPEFEYARELLNGALEDEINYPMWLWGRAMHAAALFPDTSLAADIAKHLIANRGPKAFQSIWESGLAVDVTGVRGPYVEWLVTAQLPLAVKWQQLKQLLPASVRDANYQQGENILDQMEHLAEQAADIRAEFVEFLGDHRNYSPAWEPPDAAHSLTKLYELDSNSSQGIGLLHQLFFQLHNEDNPSFATVGPQIVDRMFELGANEETLKDLRRYLPASEATSDADSGEDGLREVAVCILYVGGNETQAGYEDNLRKKLAHRLPNLDLRTIFPGWGSNWIVHLDQVRALLPTVDAVVLNRLVRTQFGRAVRRNCSSETPWWPCTGKGLKALESSIEAAAMWAAAQKNSG
jgi:hypothetical protein